MALEISMTGSGTIGDITPGWSVSESATPVAIGENGAGTGTVNFTARSTEDSLLCINNDVTSTVNGFGTLSGVVQSVNESGATTSITHGTYLDKFNLDMNMPPLLGGDVVSALDYFEQAVIGNPRTSKTDNSDSSNQFFTMTGHGYCFLQDSNNRAVYKQPTVSPQTISYVGTGSEEVNYSYLDIRNQLSCGSFSRINGNIYANNIAGNMFYSEPSGGADLSSTFTITIGSSATATYTGGFITNNASIVMGTTGSLPNISGTLTGLMLSAKIVGSGFSARRQYWYVCAGHKVEVGDTVVVTGFITLGGGSAPVNGTFTVQQVDGNSFYCGYNTATDYIIPMSGPGSATVTGPFRDDAYPVNVTSTTFKLALQPDGAALTTTGTQSGTHTVTLTDSANRASRIYYKTMLNGNDNTLNLLGDLYILDFDWVLDANLFIDYSAKTIGFTGEYSLGGEPAPMTASASIASLDVDAELAVFLQYYVTPGSNYKLTATICNTSDYDTYVTVTQTLSNSATPVIGQWSMIGNARDVYVEVNVHANASLTTEQYTIPSSMYVDESTADVQPPVISYAGVFWEYLQMACAATGQELSVRDNTVTVRDVGTRTFDITNVVASPSLNPASTLSGKQININYTGSTFIDGVIYDAQNDGNKVITVEAGNTTVESVKHTVHPISVQQPTRYLAGTDAYGNPVFNGPLPDGSYFIIDSTDLPIAANQWEDYGGSLSVEIDHEDPSAIQITLVGPYVEIPSTTGPYRVAVSSSEQEYGALKILGSGVYSGTNSLELLTGIDPDKYTRATVKTITNPFISTNEQAYDRGIWAAQKASGPVVTMSATVPNSSITNAGGIGLTCGSLVNYRNSTYRITSSSIGPASTTINAERYVTVADVDAIWSGQTVLEYDSLWGSYECQDQIIFPYKEA